MGTDPFRTGLVRVELACMHKGTRRILRDTLAVFRDSVSYLIHVAAEHFDELEGMGPKESLTAMESLVHRTRLNPDPEYHEFDTLFHKFPSYLRRAAIHAALGHVRSHETRCDQYYKNRDFEVERGHHYKKMAPAFIYTPNACPTLYRKESFSRDGDTIRIKARVRNTWDWIDVRVPARDMKCLLSAASHGTVKNPKLVFAYNKFYLEFPVEYHRVEMQDVPLSMQTVLAVDLGLNHGAVASVVDASGTILARDFDPFHADTDRILHVINLIRRKASTSGKGQSLSSLYTKLEGLKDNFAKQLARWITDLAVKYNVYGIVLEHLGDIHGRKKRRRGSLKARVHHWAVARIRDLVRGMAFREGIRTFLVNPRGTSMYAYDGSGKAERCSTNYSLCVFASGKYYNADLSASYNIGARYFLRAIKKSIPEKDWSELKAKVPGLSKRTTWTLDTLRKAHQEMLHADAALAS